MSSRERKELVERLSRGDAVSQIAIAMNVSERTVYREKARIKERGLGGATDRVEEGLTRWSLAYGADTGANSDEASYVLGFGPIPIAQARLAWLIHNVQPRWPRWIVDEVSAYYHDASIDEETLDRTWKLQALDAFVIHEPWTSRRNLENFLTEIQAVPLRPISAQAASRNSFLRRHRVMAEVYEPLIMGIQEGPGTDPDPWRPNAIQRAAEMLGEESQ